MYKKHQLFDKNIREHGLSTITSGFQSTQVEGFEQMAVAFVNSKPSASSTLISATNMTQLKADIDSISLKLSTRPMRK